MHPLKNFLGVGLSPFCDNASDRLCRPPACGSVAQLNRLKTHAGVGFHVDFLESHRDQKGGAGAFTRNQDTGGMLINRADY